MLYPLLDSARKSTIDAREALEKWGQLYYEQYSTTLSKPREVFVSGYERCYAYAISVDLDEARKNLNKALMAASLASFVGASLVGAWVVPAMALSMSKIYLLSHGLDYLSIILAEHSKVIEGRSPEEAEYYKMASSFIKSLSDRVLIFGAASALAAPIVGVLSHIQIKMAYDILVPASSALIRTLGFELTKGKDAVLGIEVERDKNQDYLFKAVLGAIGYKFGLIPFIAASSFSTAYIAAEKDITKVPEHMWTSLNSSMSFCAQYFLLGLSDTLLSSMALSSTALAGVFIKSLNLSLIEKATTPIKSYFPNVHEKVEGYYKDIKPVATEIMTQIDGYASRVKKEVASQVSQYQRTT